MLKTDSRGGAGSFRDPLGTERVFEGGYTGVVSFESPYVIF
jgi:hypothetical protein